MTCSSLRNPLNDWEKKSGGFACACFSTADQILAAKYNRDCLKLDRCWFGISEGLAAPHLCGRKTQLRKIHTLLLSGPQPNSEPASVIKKLVALGLRSTKSLPAEPRVIGKGFTSGARDYHHRRRRSRHRRRDYRRNHRHRDHHQNRHVRHHHRDFRVVWPH